MNFVYNIRFAKHSIIDRFAKQTIKILKKSPVININLKLKIKFYHNLHNSIQETDTSHISHLLTFYTFIVMKV